MSGDETRVWPMVPWRFRRGGRPRCPNRVLGDRLRTFAQVSSSRGAVCAGETSAHTVDVSSRISAVRLTTAGPLGHVLASPGALSAAPRLSPSSDSSSAALEVGYSLDGLAMSCCPLRHAMVRSACQLKPRSSASELRLRETLLEDLLVSGKREALFVPTGWAWALAG
eukprot:scaffold130178_cov28-Tisochrysis_lutea.AAC.2